ncbi:MAG: oligosaccharide flippase family protein [Acetobacter sp.]|uniref:lipopolysaccharide biosynthesis protein n=1 Tax=Acetobacter sp. TaxID=440 RepID=UPI0039EAEBC4
MTETASPPGAHGGSILRGALASLGVRLLDLPSRYGFHLLIAASLGVIESGRFYIVFSTVVALSGFGRLGIDRALTRQLAVDTASGQDTAVRPAIRNAQRLVLLASLAASAALVAGAEPFAVSVLHKPDLTLPLMLSALTILPQNIGTTLAGALAGLHRITYSQMIYSWLWPAIFCIFAIPLMFVGRFTVTSALVLIAASFALTAAIGLILLRRFAAPFPVGGKLSENPHFLSHGLSFFTLELTQLLITSAPSIALGIAASAQQTGLFALAWRVALVNTLLISGVTGMTAPKFAALHAQGNLHGLNKSAAQAIGLVLCLALPVTGCMLLFPGHLLAVFGHGYSQGAATLRILALGQLVAACFTGMPELLGMTAHMAALRKINALSLGVLLAGLAILVPMAGSIGAAIATSLAIALNAAAAAWAAHRLLGIIPLATVWHGLLARLHPIRAEGRS